MSARGRGRDRDTEGDWRQAPRRTRWGDEHESAPHASRSQQMQPSQPPQQQQQRGGETYELFVRNLPANCTDAELRGVFTAAGIGIASARVARDKTTRAPANYGFVCTFTKEEAMRAKGLRELQIRDKVLAPQLSTNGQAAMDRGLPRLRVGVYFGSFDPVHENHVGMAEYALTHPVALDDVTQRRVPLDHVVMVPNPDQPEKPFLSHWGVRVRMLHARLDGHPKIHVFDEVEGRKINWQGRADVCNEVRDMFSVGALPRVTGAAASSVPRFAVEIFQLIGQDSFDRPTAQAALGLQRSLNRKLVVFPRAGSDKVEVAPELMEHTIVLHEYVDPVELSSTSIRTQVGKATTAAETALPGVHPAVAKIMREERLYVPQPRNPNAQLVIIVGGPGTGKGTLQHQLMTEFGFTCISPGDFYRTLEDVDPALFAKIRELRAKGHIDAHVKSIGAFTLACVQLAMQLSKSNRFCIERIEPEGLLRVATWYGGTPDLVIHLHCSPATMLARINARGRKGDTPQSNADRVRKFTQNERFAKDLASYEKMRHAKVVHVNTEPPVEQYMAETSLRSDMQQVQQDRPMPRIDGAAEMPVDYPGIVAEVLKTLVFPPQVARLMSDAAAAPEQGAAAAAAAAAAASSAPAPVVVAIPAPATATKAAPKPAPWGKPQSAAPAAPFAAPLPVPVPVPVAAAPAPVPMPIPVAPAAAAAKPSPWGKLPPLPAPVASPAAPLPVATASASSSDGIERSDSAVAEHYNQVVRNRSERKESSIRGLRNFNNACKSVLIQSTCEHLQRVIDPRSQDRHSKHRPPRLDVLDLCCGKGGDVGKLRRLVRSYVAADIAEVSVQENVLRSKDLLDESVATCFFATDCFKTDLARAVEGAGTAAPRQHYYHFVNCQFSLHYSCATEAQLRAFLRNASSRLARGGRFVATFPNMDTILARLRAARTAAGAGAAGLLQFGNGIFFVRFTKDPLSVDMSKPENVYGLEYVFHLEDAIDDCAEFLVHLPTLERIAAEHGLRIVKRWDSLLQLESSSHFSDAASHYARYGGTQLTREEQEAVSLYQAVVFEQTLAAHPAVADVAANRDNNAMLVPIKSAMMQRFA